MILRGVRVTDECASRTAHGAVAPAGDAYTEVVGRKHASEFG